MVDAAGRVVPNAADVVTFSASAGGVIVGGGNGDPACHVADHAASRPAYHGRVLVIVRAEDNHTAGEIAVTATAVGLLPATRSLKVVAPAPHPRL